MATYTFALQSPTDSFEVEGDNIQIVNDFALALRASRVLVAIPVARVVAITDSSVSAQNKTATKSKPARIL